MRALIWKEVRQQLAWLLVALALSTALWFGLGNVWEQLVVSPNATALWSLAGPLLYAFALAQLQFGRDGDTRRFGLLVHRQQGPRGYFASKLIVGVASLACVAVLPMSLWAVTMSFLDPDAALIRWVRIPQAALFCVPLLIVYAKGVLSTQLRRGALLRWGVAIGGTFGASLLVLPLALRVAPGPQWWIVWVGIDVLFACGVLWLARALLLQGRDRDLPLRDRQLCGIALVAFLVLLPFASFLLGSAESWALNVIVAGKPAILFDSASQELVVARRSEDGWRRSGGAGVGGVLKHVHSHRFTDEQDRPLEIVHHAGSAVVEGAEEAREYLEAISKCRTISDQAPREPSRSGMQIAAVRAAEDPAAPIGKAWAVHAELDGSDGALRIDVSRRAESLPPLQWRVSRPDGRFSPQAGFLGYRTHAPLVLDRADGTLWRVRLEHDGARVLPLVLPQGDRVTGLEPLFQREPALLGRFEQQYFDSEDRRMGCLIVGRQGKYVIHGDELVPFEEVSQLEDGVTFEAARALARYAVTSTWPDAFTEQFRVERLEDHQVVFEGSAGPETSGARTAAAMYGGLAFLRAPAGILAERLWGWSSDSGTAVAPFAKQKQLFADGRHPLLFALVLLGGTLQLFLGWRWLERGGAGPGVRVVYMLLILVGGVAALILTRLLLPRGLRAAGASEALSWTGDSPRPLHASSPRS